MQIAVGTLSCADLLTMLMIPFTASLPQIVPPGPRMTSIRSMFSIMTSLDGQSTPPGGLHPTNLVLRHVSNNAADAPFPNRKSHSGENRST
jgi:hypothetical protein